MRMDNMINLYSSKIATDKISSKKPTEQKINQNIIREPFEKILQKQIEQKKLTFSKHAQLRMAERAMNLTDSHMDKLNEAVNRASQKGVKDSLVLMDKMAFVVSIINNTVVTAMNDKDLEGSVFTQIDGAVII